MKTYARFVLILCLTAPVIVALLLITPAAVSQPDTIVSPVDEVQPAAPLAGPVVFLHDPNWPVYAQTEITVDPEPPIPGRPTEVCAWVLNTSDTPQTVTVDFGVANFGIGLPFSPIGSRTIVVPPFGRAKVCVIWIPRQPGHWCLQAILHVPQFPDERSQRNIDIWEYLQPGVPAVTVFPLQNPLTMSVPIHLEAKPNPNKPGWGISLFPTDVDLGPGQQMTVTLVVTPPVGSLLGSREPIVDVEAYAPGQPPLLIGGFRKMDWPPVPLHRPQDPPFAESEISVEPYPPLPGEPARICVDLFNLSDEPQTVELDFDVASFGIGLPFTPIDHQVVTLPPHGRVKVCTMWIPPEPGHFCVQVRLHDPQRRYVDQFSQRNLDVNEILKPGVLATTVFPVGNNLPVTTTIYLTTTRLDSFFDVFFDVDVLPDMAPGEIRPVVLNVIPGQGPMPDDLSPIADVEAYALDSQQNRIPIGGFRKIFRPPIPIHNPNEPPYAESEISVEPYPPRAGEPTVICTELSNPTDVTQTVHVEFGIANFGIGVPFVPIDGQVVEIPPHGKIRVCTTWVPPIGGHFCAQIIIRQQGYRDVVSQRNMDVAEFLRPGIADQYAFPVGNPFTQPVTITLGLVEHLPGWQVQLSAYDLFNVQPGTYRIVTMTVVPDGSIVDLPDESPVVDVEAYVGHQLIGGFRKVFRPPVPIHHPQDPPYAEREISIDPYPPRAGEPTHICVELRNPTNVTQTVEVEFAIANFGIGLPFQPIQSMPVTLPPNSVVRKCVVWVPPFAGHFCAQVSITHPQLPYRVVRSQRNIDVGEVFVPGQPTEPFVFPVQNPLTVPTTIELATIVHLKDWQAIVQPRVLPNMQPGETRPVTLTVLVPPGPLPPDDTPIVDVEGYAQGQLIGGFRKIFRPPVPIHQPRDPIYAESEIHINPYPPRAGQPTEICAEIRNPTDVTQTFTVTFSVANFGIGLPFHPINTRVITLPPHSFRTVCVMWVPPFAGHFCAMITIKLPGHEPVWSQRNMDVGETFIPGQPSTLMFPVGNPTTGTVTVTLGLVPHVEGWGIELSQDVLPNLAPNAVRMVTLTVTPPLNRPFPPPDAPVVDVEAYIGRELIGGFRKLFNPPVPVHPPRDPVYAESEIFVDPYPTRVGVPTVIGAFVFNPTDVAQQVTVTFSVAHFGIGMPFTKTGILTPTMVLNIPPHGMSRAQTIWMPIYNGHFCVQIQLQSAGHEPVWSQRNIDVGEPLRPDQPHARIVEVRNPTNEVVTITMALINHRPEWQVSITPTLLTNVGPGVVREVTLMVKPPTWEGLADERPIADVEAYINGELIGGIRKIAKPPIPIHKPQDRPYAETEISVTPYPLQAGKPATITTDIVNTSEETQTIRVEFWVANFGFGIPFTNTNIVPTYRVITLGPGLSQTVGAVWTPPSAGNWCIQIRLRDPNNQYPDQFSQRNVHVERRDWQPCVPFTKDFWLQNSTPLTVTVMIGANAINLPPGWTYSTNITQTVLGPYQGITVTLTITPPCGLSKEMWLTPQGTLDTGGASGPATIDVEGYVDGELLGGIEVQLEAAAPEHKVYLPILLKQ